MSFCKFLKTIFMIGTHQDEISSLVTDRKLVSLEILGTCPMSYSYYVVELIHTYCMALQFYPTYKVYRYACICVLKTKYRDVQNSIF